MKVAALKGGWAQNYSRFDSDPLFSDALGLGLAINVAFSPFMWLYKLSVAMLALKRKKSGRGRPMLCCVLLASVSFPNFTSGPGFVPGLSISKLTCGSWCHPAPRCSLSWRER